MIRAIPRTVVILGIVSLLTDLSSEMIYPLLPVFLAGLGAGALTLGFIEGIAESTASLLKVASGFWTDRSGRRKPLVLGGYGLSGLVRPLIGLAGSWPFVLACRFGDRIGKGLRTAPRDALIADATPPEIRGAAYGFHRAMDHFGAVLGPLVAAMLLSLAGLSLATVFLLAIIPGVFVIFILAFGLREKAPAETATRGIPPRGRLRDLNPGFRAFLAIMGLFTLGNSSDMFLLLRLRDTGISPSWIAILWSLHHVVKVVATSGGGLLADKVDRRWLIAFGWIVYAGVYGAFGFTDSKSVLIALFMAYGIYYGLTEPAEKALVASLVPANLRGTAFGFYHGVMGFGLLPASFIFGWLWQSFGAPAAFLTGSALALAAAGGMVLMVRERTT
ncbi:MAG: MFS transporter [Planctomycetota bacterium]